MTSLLKNWPYRSIAIAWAVWSLLAAGFYDLEVGLIGFPDGHVTPYEQQTLVLRHILIDACALQGVCFFVLAAVSKTTRVFRLCVAILVAATVIVAPMIIVWNCSGLSACVGAYEFITKTHFDDGAGG